MSSPASAALAADVRVVDPATAPANRAEPAVTTARVPVLRWPTQDDMRRQLAEAGRPRLLLLGPDQPPLVVVDPLEDWARDPIDPGDLAVRIATLDQRARHQAERPRFDADGLLWVGDRWVDIPDAQRAVAELLVGRLGRVVHSDEILAACAAAGLSTHANAVKALIGRLVKRFTLLGLELHNVRGRGYLLQRATSG